MPKRTPMVRGPRPDPRALAAGKFAADREGHVLAIILNGDSDGTNMGILAFLKAHPPKDYYGLIREPTVRAFTKSAVEAGIIEARQLNGVTVYIPLADGPDFARATPKGLRFRRQVISATGSSAQAGDAARLGPARAPADFLSYWVPKTAARELEQGSALSHAASDQYDRLREGDRVYVVTVWPGGQLVLLGRVVVGRRVDQVTARQIRGTDDLWNAEWHILAQEGTEEPITEIDLSDLAADLTFESDSARLTVNRGRVNPQQLQSMRRLTRTSADALDGRLRSARGAERKLAESVREVGQGFGDPESNRKVEVRAIAMVTAHYQKQGWYVESREAENLGYDLLCTRKNETLKVEVKGARGAGPAFILTANELSAAKSENSWLLAIVTSALSDQPQPYLVESRDLDRYFTLRPLAYRGSPHRDPAALAVKKVPRSR